MAEASPWLPISGEQTFYGSRALTYEEMITAPAFPGGPRSVVRWEMERGEYVQWIQMLAWDAEEFGLTGRAAMRGALEKARRYLQRECRAAALSQKGGATTEEPTQ